MNTADLILRNKNRWAAARITREAEFAKVAAKLVASKPRYMVVADRTGVPWFIIAVIHQREASQNWMSNLAQGDPWNRMSIHVPKGRGPFNTWEQAAVDALTNCAPFAAKWRDWTPGGALTLLETYNGLGYFSRGLPSPYVWSGTDQYAKGKYVSDGVFDPNVVDVQLGCAGLIMAMHEIDASVNFIGTTQPAPPPPDIAASPAPPPAPAPAPQYNLLSTIIAFVAGLFKRT